MKPITKQEFAFVADALKRFKLIHWLFIIFVLVPVCIISFPFWLAGLVGNMMQAGILWIATKLPDYNPAEDARSLNPD